MTPDIRRTTRCVSCKALQFLLCHCITQIYHIQREWLVTRGLLSCTAVNYCLTFASINVADKNIRAWFQIATDPFLLGFVWFEMVLCTVGSFMILGQRYKLIAFRKIFLYVLSEWTHKLRVFWHLSLLGTKLYKWRKRKYTMASTLG